MLCLITVSFFMMRFAPGGPFSAERNPDPAIQRALESKYRLDEPLWKQYALYLAGLAHGDLGPSTKHRSFRVQDIIARTLPHSMLLGSLALMLAVASGCLFGIFAALWHRRAADTLAMLLALVGLSLPAFVIGPLLQLGLATRLGWLPTAGYADWNDFQYLVMPAITLALPFSARIARLTRAGMLDVLGSDPIRTARAKGLSKSRVVTRHAMRLALLPVVSYLGPAAAMITTGSLVVEKIFQIPGLGREFVEAALNRDYTLVMGTVIVYGSLIIVFNLLSDLMANALDPRMGNESLGNAGA